MRSFLWLIGPNRSNHDKTPIELKLMKVVILAGGFGTRITEESATKPKPMIEIGGRPILWHIMNIYATHGITEFIIAVGYKGEMIKEYFLNFYALNSDLSIDLATGKATIREGNQPNWKVHLVDTGLLTNTGGRLKRLSSFLEEDETFMFTYGDGVGDIDLGGLLKYHQAEGRLATLTTVRTPARFGRIGLNGSLVHQCHEKPEEGEGWINGGYFVLHRKVLDYIEGDSTAWERQPLERLTKEGQLAGYQHTGFWSCMDTLKEKNMLEEMWNSGNAPWKIWK